MSKNSYIGQELLADWADQSYHNTLTLQEYLGNGGQATVYQATQSSEKGKVAAKLPNPERILADYVIQGFLKEGEIARSLSHPNILPVQAAGLAIDIATKNELPLIVMEPSKARTVQTYLDIRGRFPVKRILEIAEQTATALDYLHSEQGVVHGDIKPANLLYAKSHIQLIDFGAAHYAAGPHSIMAVGSPPYMPPEQFVGKETAAADVYALGVSTYQMATGRLPFSISPTGKNDPFEALYDAHVTQPVPEFATVLGKKRIPRPLEALQAPIALALSKSPADRPSALEFSTLLEEAAAAGTTEQRKSRSIILLGSPAITAMVQTQPSRSTAAS